MGHIFNDKAAGGGTTPAEKTDEGHKANLQVEAGTLPSQEAMH
jgi:hypothetical protein